MDNMRVKSCFCQSCDIAASVKEAMALSEQAAQAIDQQVGDKPQIGFLSFCCSATQK